MRCIATDVKRASDAIVNQHSFQICPWTIQSLRRKCSQFNIDTWKVSQSGYAENRFSIFFNKRIYYECHCCNSSNGSKGAEGPVGKEVKDWIFIATGINSEKLLTARQGESKRRYYSRVCECKQRAAAKKLHLIMEKYFTLRASEQSCCGMIPKYLKLKLKRNGFDEKCSTRLHGSNARIITFATSTHQAAVSKAPSNTEQIT